MATRTQKAAMKDKAAAAKAVKYAKGKAVRKTPGKGKSRGAPRPLVFEESAPPTFMERFRDRLAQRARNKQAAAHQREVEREAAEREAEQAQAAAAREAQRQAVAEGRRQSAAAAREAKRLAEEEDTRREQEAREAKAAKARAAREAKAAATAAAAQAKADKAAERANRRKAVAIGLDETREPGPESEPKPGKEAPDAVLRFDETPADRPSAQQPPSSELARAKRVPPPATDIEAQADRFAAELASRRSKPIQIDAEEDAVPVLPVGRRAAPAEPKEVLTLDPAPPARIEAAPRGLSVPEQFLLLTLEGTWDERRERDKPGGLGGALAGALVLDLMVQGKVRVQRDRFQLTGAEVDAAAAQVAQKLALWPDRPSLQVMQELAKWIPQLLPVYKQRMAVRGLLESAQWRHLGLFYRSQTALRDVEAQERLRNKLGRAIAGGGRPDAPTILALGLLEACGQFGLVVPQGAQAYNRKRLNGLLAGKDVMGYKVDDELKGMQEIAVRTVLDNVRRMTR